MKKKFDKVLAAGCDRALMNVVANIAKTIGISKSAFIRIALYEYLKKIGKAQEYLVNKKILLKKTTYKRKPIYPKMKELRDAEEKNSTNT